MTAIYFQILRISQTTGQMRLSCRRRSTVEDESILQRVEEAAEDEGDYDERVLEEAQCKRRMAVVMD